MRELTSLNIIDPLLKVLYFFIIIIFVNYFNLTKPIIIEDKNIVPPMIPKVSVFLPIYNKAEYLKRSINSIQNQTLKEVEIVAVNDCSTDDTLKVLKILARNDSRIKIINNDRNHGLLYSRAMGMINCTGEYVVNLDPDDLFQGINNLEILYKVAKYKNSDIVLFLLKKHQPGTQYASEINKDNPHVYKDISKYITTKYKRRIDYLITNKFTKREIILKAYETFKSKIHSNRWNFHEDNIWNSLIHRYAKSKVYVDRIMYIYLLTKESLMRKRSFYNPLEIKNLFYKNEMFYILNKKTVWHCNYLIYCVNGYYRKTIRDDREFRNKIIRYFYVFYNLFKKNELMKQKIQFMIDKLSNKKIIIFNKSYKENLNKNLTYRTVYRYLLLNTKKTIMYVDSSIEKNIKDILSYIFPDDILLGIDEVFFQPKFEKILKDNKNNKLVIFAQNINKPYLWKKRKFAINSHPNYSFYCMNLTSYKIAQTFINKTHLFYSPNFIINWANFINYEINSYRNNISILFEKKIEIFNNIEFKNIISKYFYKNITYKKISKDLKLKDEYNQITEMIKSSKIIITDNLLIMKLSAVFSTSCIIFEDNNHSQEVNEIFKNLDYIKYIHDINDFEETFIKLINISEINFNYTKLYDKYSDSIKKEFQ